MFCKKIVMKSKEVKTVCSLTESSKEGYCLKKAILPMMMMAMLRLLMIIPAFSHHVTVLLECRTTTLGRAKSIFCFLDFMAITNESQHEKCCMEIINTSKTPA
jgi:membrane protein CcdC involved in cytochrome C biogenesis